MDSDVAPEAEQTNRSLKSRLTAFKRLPAALSKLPIPKKLRIPAIAAVVLVAAAGAFGLLHATKHAAPAMKAAASAPVASAAAPSATGSDAAVSSAAASSASCSGVVRDIYRQTVREDPDVTLAEVRSEVASSGINCTPVPEIAAELKDLSPACRDMVQYTVLNVRNGHPDIKVSDIRDKVVMKSVACEHDRPSNTASVAPHAKLRRPGRRPG